MPALDAEAGRRRLALRPGVADAIKRHGSETYPDECCGALIGRDDGCRFFLRINAVPMGWVHAVQVAQAVSRSVSVVEAGLDEACEVHQSRPFPAKNEFFINYIDDFNMAQVRPRGALALPMRSWPGEGIAAA